MRRIPRTSSPLRTFLPPSFWIDDSPCPTSRWTMLLIRTPAFDWLLFVHRSLFFAFSSRLTLVVASCSLAFLFHSCLHRFPHPSIRTLIPSYPVHRCHINLSTALPYLSYDTFTTFLAHLTQPCQRQRRALRLLRPLATMAPSPSSLRAAPHSSSYSSTSASSSEASSSSFPCEGT